MIGSIGAESRYSTGYNNLKPNRNQNKWADTLAQTVDKEDISSRADINRAKKSTVMDSYLALSGKTINTLKQEYSEYESENYRIVPDNEAECFDIYNKDGERLGAFSYSDIKIRQDETTGKQFLISEHGTMSYDALVLDDELKDALQNVMDKDSLDVETLQGFTLNTHSDTGIQYLVKDGEEGRGGKVLLQNEADRKRYEELAEMYFDKYPNLIESPSDRSPPRRPRPVRRGQYRAPRRSRCSPRATACGRQRTRARPVLRCPGTSHRAHASAHPCPRRPRDSC